jgi:hypothetical protein
MLFSVPNRQLNTAGIRTRQSSRRPARRRGSWPSQARTSAKGRSWWFSSLSTCEPVNDRCRRKRTFGPGIGATAASLDLTLKVAAGMQRKEPLAVGGRTHCERHQADIQSSGRRHHERQQCVAQRTPCRCCAISHRERPVPVRATGSSRPTPDIHFAVLVAAKRSHGRAAQRQRASRIRSATQSTNTRTRGDSCR